MSTSAAVDPGPPRGRRTLWMALMAALLVALSVYGIVARDRLAAQASDSAASPGELIPAAQGRDSALAAVGQVTGLSEPCTAWLVDLRAPAGSTARAITTGRCIGIEDSATVTVDLPAVGASVEFSDFAPTSSGGGQRPVRVGIGSVAWASVRDTDLAVLDLEATYADLRAQGIDPIGTDLPLEPGGQVLLAGVPTQGIPGDEQHLRGTRCAVGGDVQLLASPWWWPAIQSSDCGGFLAGSAGSPALDPTGRAVGMAVTTTIGVRGDERDCYVGRPCEVSGDDLTVVADRTYLVDVNGLAECFPSGVLRLGDGCGLEDPSDVLVATAPSSTARPGSDVRIDVEVPSSRAAVGVRVGAIGATDCADPMGWRTVLAEDGRLTVAMPMDTRFALVCVGSPESPTPIVIGASLAAPDGSALALEQQPVPGGVQVRPTSTSPSITGFLWTASPTGSVDCATAEGYVEYAGEPATFQVADLPVTVCVIGITPTGIRTSPASFRVSLPGD